MINFGLLHFQRFYAETWHKSMLRKEILKCDKNSATFQTGVKKAGRQTHFFYFVKQVLKTPVQRKFDTCIVLMF